MKISTVSQMRRMDRSAMEIFGIPGEILMENAGLAVCSAITGELEIPGKKFIVFCGMGNNGGDGFVIARKIHSNGGLVKVFILGDRRSYSGDAKSNLGVLERIIPGDISEVDTVDAVRIQVNHCAAIIDAILGTGLTRNVAGLYRDVIELINASGKPVFSVDIPSGVHGDTGEIMGVAIKARATVALGLPKIGNLLYPGFELCGKLHVSHISFPTALHRDLDISINTPIELPKRNTGFHKGQFGNLLCVAGAAGYFGAPYFSALSFLKSGGGYARLAAPGSITPFIAQKGSEIVFLPQRETPEGSLSIANKEDLLTLSSSMDMVILGPGVSLNEETQNLIRDLVQAAPVPILIDGDGITAVSKDLEIIKKRSAPTILTPHTGEMARITGLTPREIQADKISVLKAAAKNLEAFMVLKGPHSLIGCPDGRVYINLSGNSGMATAGSGDVLTGVIAAMYTAGLSVEDAVRKGVFIHGLSGDLAALEKGEDGMTAQDILDTLPAAVRKDRNGLNDILRKRYAGANIL
jgi:hydroxyethylthiazole kinase-like uncharacterized protein yjeF